MKLVIAIIPEENLESVLPALEACEATLISTGQVFTGDSSCEAAYRGARFSIRRTKLRLEVAVGDHGVERVVATITRHGYPADPVCTGELRILVIPLEACALATPCEIAPALWTRPSVDAGRRNAGQPVP